MNLFTARPPAPHAVPGADPLFQEPAGTPCAWTIPLVVAALMSVPGLCSLAFENARPEPRGAPQAAYLARAAATHRPAQREFSTSERPSAYPSL